MDSIWVNGVEKPNFPTLDGDLKTDVLIIGGGITGLLCARLLREAGIDYALVEAKEICSGVTGRTTAKLTVQHGLIYDKLIKRYGEDDARKYLKLQERGASWLGKIAKEGDCDYEACDAYVYSVDGRECIERELRAYERLGAKAEFAKTELPIDTCGAVLLRNQAQINPLKLLYKLAKDLNVFENTKVTEMAKGAAITDRGKISYKIAIVATHFPFLNKHGAFYLKLYQSRSYVLALGGAVPVNGIYVDGSGKGLSFRNYGEALLLGGGSHRTGKKSNGWDDLTAFAEKHYPEARQICRWATQDCMTLDGMPYVGEYSSRTEGLYVATGYNKWGLSSAATAAIMLTELICTGRSEYSNLLSPARSILHPQLALNAAEAIIGLITPIAPRCPHLGCALKYNKWEHSWDCPCHGSRFSEDGRLINNPATDDKR